jgi:hypothetical protein
MKLRHLKYDSLYEDSLLLQITAAWCHNHAHYLVGLNCVVAALI